MKKLSLFILSSLLVFTLTGCTGGSSSSELSQSASNGKGFAISNTYDDSYSEDSYSEENTYSEEETSNDEVTDLDNEKVDTTEEVKDSKPVIDKKKIIYTSSVKVNVKDIGVASDSLKELLDKNGGFIESDSYDKSEYSYETSYTAKCRVPCDKYEDILSNLSDKEKFGDIVNKTSNSENVTQEYTTLSGKVELLNIQRERYIKQLKETSDENVILQLQSHIDKIDLELSEYKSRMANIDIEVAYSTIDVTFISDNEYKSKSSQFKRKVRETLDECKESLGDFFLMILQLIIIYIPRILIFLIIAVLLFKFLLFLLKITGIRKGNKKQKKSKNSNKVIEEDSVDNKDIDNKVTKEE